MVSNKQDYKCNCGAWFMTFRTLTVHVGQFNGGELLPFSSNSLHNYPRTKITETKFVCAAVTTLSADTKRAFHF